MPIRTVQDLIDQLSLLPAGSTVGIGSEDCCIAIKAIHSVELFGSDPDAAPGTRTSAFIPCIILEPFEQQPLPSIEEIKAKMALHGL